MLDCTCVAIQADLETEPEFVNRKMARAAKEHICTECSRTITKGEKYEYVVGTWYGEFRTYKTCSDCLSVREELFDDNWFYECIWEDVEAHISRYGEKVLMCDLNSMTELARDRLLDLVEKSWNTN